MHRLVVGLLILMFHATFHLMLNGQATVWISKRIMQLVNWAKQDVHPSLVHHLRTTHAQRRRLFTIYCERKT